MSMRFTKRDMEMMEYLKDYEAVELSSMADYLGESVKTLKNQLKRLSETMEKYGVTMQFLSGNRVMIEGREKFADIMSVSIPRFEMEFEKRFLLLLVLHNDFLIIQDIADELLVSKSYAEKQMASIFKKYPEEILSQRHYGIRYAGTQDQRREMFVSILFPYIFGEDYTQALRQFHQLHFPIFDYFTEEQGKRAEEGLTKLRTMEWFRFTDESLQQLFLYLLFLARHGDGKSEEKPTYVPEKEKPDFAGLYEWLCVMCHQLQLPESEEEIQYLYVLLLSLRKQKMANQEQIIEKMSYPIGEILRGIHEKLSVDLSEDAELIQGLSTHLYTTVLRGDHLNVESDFYMVKSMKRQYPFGFEMAAITANFMADMYDLSMRDDELIYLAIHFQAAIERLKDEGEKVRILIVCHFGSAAGRIIQSRMERRIPDVEIAGIYSLQEFSQMESPECDCIVTTERILKTELPVIYVSLALPERELRKIAECIREIQVNHLLELNILEAIIIPVEEEEVSPAIEAMVQPLSEEDFVEPGYLQTVLEREETSSTSLSYIAMPHGNPALVQRTRLVIGRMKQPLLWDGSRVSCIFLFAISSELLKEKPQLFSTFYRILADPDVEEKIRKLQMQEYLPDEVFRQKLFQILR